MKKLLLIGFLLIFGNVLSFAQNNSVDELLKKAGDIQSLYYEEKLTIVNNMSGQSNTNSIQAKVWFKNGYQKKETSINNVELISIVRPDASFMYDSNSKKFDQIDNGESSELMDIYNILHFKVLLSNDYKVLGVEDYEGKSVTIIEIVQDVGQSKNVETFWIWNEKGIPLKYKQEMIIGENSIVSLSEYENFGFEELSDSIFDISYEN